MPPVREGPLPGQWGPEYGSAHGQEGLGPGSAPGARGGATASWPRKGLEPGTSGGGAGRHPMLLPSSARCFLGGESWNSGTILGHVR